MADQKYLPPLAALRAFEAVGRLGGIRRAAKELMVDHAVVSRHIRSLEGWVGVQLVVRHGTGYTLTEPGAVYHAKIYAAISAIADATSSLMESEDELKLRIWCIPGFASLWLSDHLGDFIGENSDIDVDFRPTDTSPDFRYNDVDGDIRYLREWEEAALPRNVHRFEFIRPSVFPVASPGCVAALPPIRTAQDLLQAPLLHEDNDLEWQHWFKAQNVVTPERLKGSRLWHAQVTLSAARQGNGVALANRLLLRDDIEKGRLVRVLPTEDEFLTVRFGGYAFIARADRWNAQPVQRFRRWLQKTMTAYE